MFEDFIRARAIEQATVLTQNINRELTKAYLIACANWAENQTPRAASAPPVVPMIQKFILDDVKLSFEIVPTDQPVSNVKPEDLLPKFPTDADGVGGPVGGPIPGQPDKFYMKSDANVWAGFAYKASNGSIYVVQQPTPFQKYFLKIT